MYPKLQRSLSAAIARVLFRVILKNKINVSWKTSIKFFFNNPHWSLDSNLMTQVSMKVDFLMISEFLGA